MHSFLRKSNLLRLGLLALGLTLVLPASGMAKPRPGLQHRLIRLMAGTNGALTVNRIYCGLSAIGNICVDSLGSSVVGGGYWPKGTADQYVFNSGIQIAGIVDPAAGFDWAGDTTGGQLFNPRGDDNGEPVQSIFNAGNPDDLADWPQAAFVPQGDAGEENFNALLRGRASASQGDVWFMSWEGNPNLSAGRNHPLGILVEQRGMGWNYPSGNQDILYFIYTFYNVTASDPNVYSAIRPGMRELVQKAGEDFQRLNEGRYSIDIPDGGYTQTSMYAAFGADMDVAQADADYSTVVVPFSLGNTYEHTFAGTQEWSFDPGIFGPPFFAGAGFVGVKYLKSPISPTTGAEVGLSLFSNTINQGVFDDASNITQLYRYISNNISTAAGDASCTYPPATKICYVNNGQPDDMRFFQSSGPLTLAPGQFQSIVVAYIFAAPVAVGACTAAGSCDVAPGDPTRWLTASTLANGANQVDSVAGFLDYSDANGDNVVQQEEVTTVPGSLLGKSLVAQEVFNNRFLLPFAPETPNFFLVGGDNQVTVLWQPSASETTGDPFFAIAQQPTTVPEGGGAPVPNVLFDPNYRQFDVEGYRVYRGRVDAPNSLTMLAQYDYSGTFITDFTGGVNPLVGCAPELGINTVTVDTTVDTIPTPDVTSIDTTFGCPVPFDSVAPGVAPTVSTQVPLVGQLTQVATSPAGSGRIPLANGQALLTVSDTAITGAGTGCPAFAKSAAECPLRDTGVPFVFVDNTVRNNLRYFYSVTAFDINSFQSGPSSLESPRSTKSVTPASLATNAVNDVVATTNLLGRGTVMDTAAPNPAIDPATGTFSGPFPAANGWTVGLGATVSQVLQGETQVSARLDSIQLGSTYQGIPHTYWFTASAAGASGVLSAAVAGTEEFGITSGVGNSPPVVPVNEERSSTFGGNSSFRLTASAGVSLPGTEYLTLYGRGCVNARPGYGDGTRCAYQGSRWFAGPSPTANETQPHPNGNNPPNASLAPYVNYNNAGLLPGVTTIFNFQCYEAGPGAGCREQTGIGAGAKRAADFNFYWGAGGLIDSVVDISNNVLVPFDTLAGGGWGFLNQAATAGGPSLDASATLTALDYSCVEPYRSYAAGAFLCPATTAAYKLSNTAVPGAVGFESGGFPGAGNVDTYTGVVPAANAGFILYVGGEWFTFELTGGALPAAGTVWSLRQYVGAILGGNGAAGDLGPYEFSAPDPIRPMTAVGAELSANLNVTNQAAPTVAEDLSRVHTVPDPYYVTTAFEQSTDTKVLKFVNLPADCIIRIYSSSGVLVSMVEHHSASFGGSVDWNLRNRNNQVVASGVYFYHVESGDARRVGRFTVVNFAQ